MAIIFFGLRLGKYTHIYIYIILDQGIVGCTPSNVPLWEIPIESPYITWVFVGKLSPGIPRLTMAQKGLRSRFVIFLWADSDTMILL